MRRYLIALSAAAVAALGLAGCSGGTPESLRFELRAIDGEVHSDLTTFEAKQGDTVTISLSADQDAALHLHGYDRQVQVPAGGHGALAIEAHATGQFDVAVHLAGGAHTDEHEHHGHEAHGGTVEGAAGMSVDIEVEPDAVSGFNVRTLTTGFTFAPERVNQPHMPGEGHAHLYVDGEKWGRIYGEWTHLEGLSGGAHEIRVTLNANTHEEYAVGGRTVSAAVTVHVQGDGPATHDGHAHEGEEVEIVAAKLVVHPR